MKRTILIVEDDAVQRFAIRTLLQDHLDYQVLEAGDGNEALHIIKGKDTAVDLVLLDITMPRMDGKEALKHIKAYAPNLPVIILTASDELDDVIDTMRLGACDFLTKPPELERLRVSITNALALNTLSQEVLRLRRQDEGKTHFEDMVGADSGIKETIALGKKGAVSDIPILITGESGVGKELFAKAIHSFSDRRNKPFVAVNCGAIPENLVESVLFGHEKGAFTGAVTQTIGKFREAEGGTLFLDEIGELKLDIQVKLLRALQQQEIEPVGSSKTVKVNVRIISATHRTLEAEVKEGNFREDLYYRLNVFPIHIPALRKREGDISTLAYYFLKKFCASEHKDISAIAPEAERWMQEYAWPGNVRELQNMVFRATVLCESDTLKLYHLTGIHQEKTAATELETVANDNNTASQNLYLDENGEIKSFAIIEYEAIKNALAYYDDNVTKAAKALGIGQSTLYRKLSAWQKNVNNA